MLGEGQLFFFYKRQEMVNIPDGNQATGTKNVELTKYVVPLPESEPINESVVQIFQMNDYEKNFILYMDFTFDVVGL